jgi:hypothetical protein
LTFSPSESFREFFTLRNHLGGISRDWFFHLRNHFGELFTLRNHLGGISRDWLFHLRNHFEMKFQRFAIISAIGHQPSSSSTPKRGYPLRATVKFLRSLVQTLALVLLLVTSRPLFISISASVI